MELAVKIDFSDRAAALLSAFVNTFTASPIAPQALQPQPMPPQAAHQTVPPAYAPPPAPAMPQAPAAAPPAPAPQVPTALAPEYTQEDISRAAAGLMDAGRMGELQGLLQQFGVAAISHLPKEQYGAFATALRGMGARI